MVPELSEDAVIRLSTDDRLLSGPPVCLSNSNDRSSFPGVLSWPTAVRLLANEAGVVDRDISHL